MEIKNITIYGAGLIGCGWITHLLTVDNRKITVFDISEEILNEAKKRIFHDLSFLVSEGVLSDEDVRKQINDVTFTTSRQEALRYADIIQENGPENMDIKQEIIADIENYCRADALICSSTSGISISEIGKNAVHPERIIGAHPYHPIYLLPLVEIIKSEKTDPEYLNTAYDFYKSIRKEPVILKKECPGYIGSRLMSVLFRECVNMIIGGVATMEDVDKAFTFGPGLRYALMGPNLVLQLAGGNQGIFGLLCGDIGNSSGDWMKSFANWEEWPSYSMNFFATCQEQMNELLENRDIKFGKTNSEIEMFRDRGLIKLLQYHGKL